MGRLGTGGRQWEEYLRQLHQRYEVDVVPLEDWPARSRPRAVILRTFPEHINTGPAASVAAAGRVPAKVMRRLSGMFLGQYTGFGPPDFVGHAGPLHFVADAKEFHGPPPRKDGTPAATRWPMADLRAIQGRDFDMEERCGPTHGAFILFRFIPHPDVGMMALPRAWRQQHVPIAGLCMLVPWLKLREHWWRWYSHHKSNVFLKHAGQTPKRAPGGLASFAVFPDPKKPGAANLYDLSIYTAAMTGFDYMVPMETWMRTHVDRRNEMQSTVPTPPTTKAIMSVYRMENKIKRAAKKARSSAPTAGSSTPAVADDPLSPERVAAARAAVAERTQRRGRNKWRKK